MNQLPRMNERAFNDFVDALEREVDEDEQDAIRDLAVTLTRWVNPRDLPVEQRARNRTFWMRLAERARTEARNATGQNDPPVMPPLRPRNPAWIGENEDDEEGFIDVTPNASDAESENPRQPSSNGSQSSGVDAGSPLPEIESPPGSPRGSGYKMRKVPKKQLYWVVNKVTGKKHSREGLPKERAKAQMRALYAAESGAVMRGKALPTMKASTLSQIARMGYKSGSELLKEIDGWTLDVVTPTLKFYRNGQYVIVGVRGSQTLSDWTDANRRILTNTLTDSKRYKEDVRGVTDFLERSPGVFLYGAGHSLGGAILDELIKAGLVLEAVSFNPAVQPKFYEDEDLAEKHKRIYYEGDPVYLIMGRYAVGAELRKAGEADWLVQYAIQFPKVPALDAATLKAVTKLASIPALATGAYASIKSHQLTPWLKDDDDLAMMKSLQKGIESFRKEAVKGGRMKGGALKGMPTFWTLEQWQNFIKYVDAVVFDTLSDAKAQTAVTIILTALGFAPQFQAALAAGLTFWEAAVALGPLVASAATGATAAPPIAIAALGISVSVGTAIAIFWALVYAHEYLYPGCTPELVKAGKACNELRTKKVSEDLYKDVMRLKAELEESKKRDEEFKKGKGKGRKGKKSPAHLVAIAKEAASRIRGGIKSSDVVGGSVLQRLTTMNRRTLVNTIHALLTVVAMVASGVSLSTLLRSSGDTTTIIVSSLLGSSFTGFTTAGFIGLVRTIMRNNPLLLEGETLPPRVREGFEIVVNPISRVPPVSTHKIKMSKGTTDLISMEEFREGQNVLLLEDGREPNANNVIPRESGIAYITSQIHRGVLPTTMDRQPYESIKSGVIELVDARGGIKSSDMEKLSDIVGVQQEKWTTTHESARNTRRVLNFLRSGVLTAQDIDILGPQIIHVDALITEWESNPDRKLRRSRDEATTRFIEALVDRVLSLPVQRPPSPSPPTSPRGKGVVLPEFPDVNPPGNAEEKRLYFRMVRDWLINVYANFFRPTLVRKLHMEENSPGSLEIQDLAETLQSIKADVEEFRDTVYYGTRREWEFVYDEALVKAGVKERD